MTDEVLIRREGAAGFLSLNRPKAIHALTLDMVHAMTQALLEWRDDPEVSVVIIDHAEGRGFCSGGDIAFLRNSALNDGGVSGRKFFHDEYQLNHLIFTYEKPVVAFMDGITMGGGVGISQPARFHVATENTRYAMPETGIGLFPDVGGGWYLSRLPGRIGQFLALTGARWTARSASGRALPPITCRTMPWPKPRNASPRGMSRDRSCPPCRPRRPRRGSKPTPRQSPSTSPRTGTRTSWPAWKATIANGQPRNWPPCAPSRPRPARSRCASCMTAWLVRTLLPTWPWNTASAAAC